MADEMKQHQEWYEELEKAGFKKVRDAVGNIDYKYPKKPDYTVSFDWRMFKVIYKEHYILYITTQLELGVFDEIVHAIKYPRLAYTDILRPKKQRWPQH